MLSLGMKDIALCLDVAEQADIDMPMAKQFMAPDWEATKETFI
jgi:hypothetical protein